MAQWQSLCLLYMRPWLHSWGGGGSLSAENVHLGAEVLFDRLMVCGP